MDGAARGAKETRKDIELCQLLPKSAAAKDATKYTLEGSPERSAELELLQTIGLCFERRETGTH